MKSTVKYLVITLLSLLAFAEADAGNGRLFTSEILSNNLVNCITQDAKGYIWIGTAYGLNKFDGYRNTVYIHNSDDSHSLNDNTVSALYSGKDGRLWVGSANGLSVYNRENDNFDRIPLAKDTLSRPRVTSFAEDSNGNLLVGTEGFGLFIIKKGESKAERTYMYDNKNDDGFYSCIHLDKKGRLWRADNNDIVYCFKANGGKAGVVFKQPLKNGSIMRFCDDDKGGVYVVCRNSIFHYDGKAMNRVENSMNKMYNCACASYNRQILLGSNGSGIHVLTTSGNIADTMLLNDNIDLNTINTTALFEDRSHNLWIGCAERGLAFVPNEKSQFQNIALAQLGIKTSGVINSFCHNDAQSVFIAVQGSGLYSVNCNDRRTTRVANVPLSVNFVYRDSRGKHWLCADKTLYSFDKASGSVTRKASFDCIYLRSMTDDAAGNLYLSIFGKGLCVYNTNTGERTDYSMFQKEDKRKGHLCNDWILQMMHSRDGKIWLGTSSGIQCFDPSTHSFKPYGWHNILEGKAIISMAEDKDGNIVIGTPEGLFLYDKKSGKTGRFPHSEAMKELNVNYIVCKKNGDLWCSTSVGIWHYNKSKQSFISYKSGNGLSGREYLEGLGLTLQNGDIVFGTPEGATLFSPNKLTESRFLALKPMLTCVIVGGSPINMGSVSGGKSIIDKPLSETDRIRLSYADNTFTLEFSTFDFANTDNVQLEYRLKGDRWMTNEEGDNAISFSHLQPGNYVLEVRTNVHGQLSPVSAYKITIRPPWYRSTEAYIVYLCLLSAVFYVCIQYYKRRKHQELDEEKMQFLINATHDIRTPLTLILNPLHQLMKQSETETPQYMDKLHTISHNANRILTLVNQILDIRKMDKAQMHLHCKETSLEQLITDVCKTFDYNAKKRGIDFRFNRTADVKVYVDRTQFDKVLTNLLSNAFKYTNDGGQITISLASDAKNAVIEVADNGVGLKEGDAERIFNRFYQSGTAAVVAQEGTGIGLNLCKMIVDMHHGTISAKNRVGSCGSVFRVTVPLGTAHLKAEEIATTDESATPTKHAGTGHRVLLVDDDTEITEYISNELSQHYRFTVCRNGKQAISELLSEKHYDIVVSDIMMPEMDGFTLLRLIKTNLNISHIPVILLTTEAAIGNRLEGLERGADAFLAKPFLLDELRATIDNLIAGRLKLKGKFSGAQQQADKVEQQEIVDSDKQLMERIMKSVNKNIGDSDFNVEQLCQEVGVSRTQLHRKMKELTGLSTTEFIRNIRLEQAARLLKERHFNISQVAYTLGFSNMAHFSKVFKQHFGISPSEYGKRNSVSSEHE